MTEKEAMMVGRLAHTQAFQQMRNRRALRVGITETSGRSPTVNYQEAGAISDVPQVGMITRHGFQEGTSVLSVAINGDMHMAANLGPSPYWTGAYEAVSE